MRRILVTGAAGFLGSHLVEALLQRGDAVVGLDNLSHGSRDNLAHLADHPRFTWREGDVRDGDLVETLAQQVESVVHLAAWKIPRYGDALATLETNGLGTYHVLASAARRGLRTVIASTSDIYGRNPDLPFRETSESVLGSTQVKRWSYAVSKLFGEHLAWAFHREQKLPVSVVRYFGGYGPRQHLSWRGGAPAVFITQALREEPLTIHGRGEQRRTFTYVSDLIEGTLRVLDEPRATGEVFNLGSTEEMRIIDLARLIWRLIHGDESEPKVSWVPYESFDGRYEDVARRVPDVSNAEQHLGFLPRVRLAEGLPQTIAWQRERLAHVPNAS